MTTTNDITGDRIKTRGANSDAYRNNPLWDKPKADKSKDDKHDDKQSEPSKEQDK